MVRVYDDIRGSAYLFENWKPAHVTDKQGTMFLNVLMSISINYFIITALQLTGIKYIYKNLYKTTEYNVSGKIKALLIAAFIFLSKQA